MQGLIGGSGSTGSSVLRQLLNRHPEFYCINESSLFCKSALYQNWNKNKARIVVQGLKGLRSSGFHIFNGVSILDLEYAPTSDELKRWIATSNSFKSFADKIAAHFRSQSGAKYIYEKTPGNAIHFKSFGEQCKGAKMIACMRHPVDTISSLVARGFDPYYATCIYLYNSSYALSYNGEVLHTKYEDLSESTDKELNRIQEFLCLKPLLLNQLNPVKLSKTDEVTRLSSWSFDERQDMQVSAKSKFKNLTAAKQEELLCAIYNLRIKQSYADKNNLSYQSIVEIAEQFSYPLPAMTSKTKIKTLKNYRRVDIWNRTKRLYPLHLFNYPMELS